MSAEERLLKIVPLLLQKSEQQQLENALDTGSQAPTPSPVDGWGRKEIDEVKRLWAEWNEINKVSEDASGLRRRLLISFTARSNWLD